MHARVMSPKHHQNTTETTLRHHRDTGTHPAQTGSREPDGTRLPLELAIPSHRYWGVNGKIAQQGEDRRENSSTALESQQLIACMCIHMLDGPCQSLALP